jgi:hypothetical protein
MLCTYHIIIIAVNVMVSLCVNMYSTLDPICAAQQRLSAKYLLFVLRKTNITFTYIREQRNVTN